METVHDLINQAAPIFKNIWVQMCLFVLLATIHGYAGAWLAVRMLFRPRNPVKVLGITIFPQGMIPRHRERLANAIGKAVGEELVSTDTIHEQLIGRDFLRKKIQSVIDSYTVEITSQDLPSLIEALPSAVRPTVLDTVAGLQRRLAGHISEILKRQETRDAVSGFITRRVDDLLGKRVFEILDGASLSKLETFLRERLKAAVASNAVDANIRDFVGRHVDEIIGSPTPLGELFTSDAVSLVKEKAYEQIDPVIKQLTELAAAEKTRDQIGALIKHEVHDYYENLSFFKKIFVSRENLLDEVDSLVNESFPKRIEETLRGTFVADEARNFISTNIDNALAKPLPELIGKIDPAQLDSLKDQISRALLSLIRRDETIDSIADYVNSIIDKLRPHSIDAILQVIHPDAEERLKAMLSNGLIDILSRDETTNIINEMISDQIERLLAMPIGRISDHLPQQKLEDVSASVTDAVIAAISAKLPDAIREFDVGGVVREKIRTYPADKLESLVMSVAKEHLRTIELFGGLFGFVIGCGQAIQLYLFAGR